MQACRNITGRGAHSALSTGCLTIDLAAIVANWRMVARRVSPAAVGAVVKANAYGLGALRVATVLASAGCRDFFVAHLVEAHPLASVLAESCAVYVLNGLAPGEEPAAAAMGVIPVLNSAGHVSAWREQAKALGRRLPAAIQVDTGMARLGLTTEEVTAMAEGGLFGRTLDVRLVMSHLARADEPDDCLSGHQLARFLALADRLPKARRSLSNSGGAFRADLALDLVRPGIALYGGAPDVGKEQWSTVVTLDAPVIQIQEVPAGTGIGYGHLHTSDRAMRLATIGVGYADGWPRALTRSGSAWFEGARLPFVGRVSMDSIILDVTALPEEALKVGHRIELLGPHRPLNVVAQEAGTIAHEILARLGPRLHRTYAGESE